MAAGRRHKVLPGLLVLALATLTYLAACQHGLLNFLSYTEAPSELSDRRPARPPSGTSELIDRRPARPPSRTERGNETNNTGLKANQARPADSRIQRDNRDEFQDDEFGDSWHGEAWARRSSGEFCRSSKHPTSGQEGEPLPSSRVEQVYVITRHGARVPMTYQRNDVNAAYLTCSVTDDVALRHVVARLNQLDADITRAKEAKGKARNQILEAFTRTFRLYPDESHCFNSRLTSEGFKQLYQLGLFLHRAYSQQRRLERGTVGPGELRVPADTSIISEGQGVPAEGQGVPAENANGPSASEEGPSILDPHSLRVVISQYGRTFHSAVALLTGLLPNSTILHMHIDAAHSVFMDGPHATVRVANCMAAIQALAKSSQKYENTFKSRDAEYKKIRRRLVDLTGYDRKQSLEQVSIDVLSPRLCRYYDTPCRPPAASLDARHNCAKFWDLATLSWRQSWHVRSNRRENEAALRSSILRIYPLMAEIVSNIDSFVNNTSKGRFYLYSGHDVTIDALKLAFGVSDPDVTPFSARFVIELRSSVKHTNHSKSDTSSSGGNAEYYVRVLYNGIPLVTSAEFCRGQDTLDHNFCRLSDFTRFVKQRLLSHFESSSYNEACEKTLS